MPCLPTPVNGAAPTASAARSDSSVVAALVRSSHAERLCRGWRAAVIPAGRPGSSGLTLISKPAAIAAQEHLPRYTLTAEVKQAHPSVDLKVQLQEENHHLNVVFPDETCIIPKTR